MPPRKAVIATFASEETARQVVEDLQKQGFAREQIGYAVSEEDDGAAALVTCTVDDSLVSEAMRVMNSHDPVKIDEREAQWRKDAPPTDSPNPDSKPYTAPEQKD